MATNLRPYYNRDTFNSPVKGSDGLTVVYGTVNNTPTLSKPHGDDNFIYLDVDMSASNEIAAIGMSMARMYSRVFVSQPFEVSRLLLQVGDWSDNSSYRKHNVHSYDSDVEKQGITEDEDEESDQEIDYFTDLSGDNSFSSLRKRVRNDVQKRLDDNQSQEKADTGASVRLENDSSPSRSDIKILFPHAIEPTSLYILDIMRAIMEKDGVVGLWRGMHTSFVLEALTTTIESWINGFLSSVCDIPDPQFVDVLHSPSPLVSLGAAVLSALATSIILSPVDMIRTRFSVTTFSTTPRSFRQSVMQLKSYTSPISVLIPTALRAGVSCTITRATPYLLFRWARIDKVKYPGIYNFTSLISSVLELVIRLPLETIIRRSHIANLNLESTNLIVQPTPYKGIFSTFWRIGTGQDRIETLYRGWRLSLMATIGNWGVQAAEIENGEKEKF